MEQKRKDLPDCLGDVGCVGEEESESRSVVKSNKT
jgi:hypothetical protein